MTNNGFISKHCGTAIAASYEYSITNILTALPATCAMSTQVVVCTNLHTMHRSESSILQLPIGDLETKCEHATLSPSGLIMWKHDQVPRNY